MAGRGGGYTQDIEDAGASTGSGGTARGGGNQGENAAGSAPAAVPDWMYGVGAGMLFGVDPTSAIGAGLTGYGVSKGSREGWFDWGGKEGSYNDIWDYLDPFGLKGEIGKSGSDRYPAEEPHNNPYPKYGQDGYGGGGYPGGPGGQGGGLYSGLDENYYSGLRGEYANMIGGLDKNVDANDPAMLAAMQNAREASARQAKLRGLSGPSSIGMSERDSYMAGLDYQQRENARRQALRAQLMGQYGNMLGGRGQLGLGYGNLNLGWGQLGEQGRQFDVATDISLRNAARDRRDQQIAGTNAGIANIPFAGPSIQSFVNSRDRSKL